MYSLLDADTIKKFIGTEKYEQRKQQRFPAADELCIAKNPAFLFDNIDEYEQLEREYKGSAAHY